MRELIEHTLKLLPDSPGVYQFFDDQNTLLYVGKAKSLQKRVRSYFNKLTFENGKTRVLVKKIADIKYILVDTEFDALLLENSLIKKYKPKYNIQLKDDKTYPWICIKKERFPRIFPTRKVIKDGSEYFGPYASVRIMNTVLDVIKQLYPLRTCSYDLSEENIFKQKFRACLEYQIGNCKAPCENKQTQTEYDENILSAKAIIKGNLTEVLKKLKQTMHEYSILLAYEKAQELKEKITFLENFQSKSTIVNPSINNVDVFTLFSDSGEYSINYLKISNGSIIQSFNTQIILKIDETEEEILHYAIVDLRERFNSTSSEIVCSHPLHIDIPGVKIYTPKLGDKKKLMDLSLNNAKFFLLEKRATEDIKNPQQKSERILQKLKSDLRLSELPVHIECFDNSNFQGTDAVAACVVFKQGKPSKKDYRHFNIKSVQGPNDFASMYEIITRRYSRLIEENSSFPQLIIIDGGKGQLSSAVKALKDLRLYGKIAIIGIAKKLEEIYFPNDPLPLYLDKKSESLKLIQHLRNEAHRFGITHHRNKRSKHITTELLQIDGIGEKTAEKLMRHFKSVKRVYQASLDEIASITNLTVAQKIKERG